MDWFLIISKQSIIFFDTGYILPIRNFLCHRFLVIDLVLHDVTPGGRSATIARSPHKALMAQWETIANVSVRFVY